MAQYHDFHVIQFSCQYVLFKPVKVVIWDFDIEFGERVISGLTPISGCHSVIRLFPLFLKLSETQINHLTASAACIETTLAKA